MSSLAFDDVGGGPGDTSSPPEPSDDALVLVHGFTQTRRSWDWYVDRLRPRHRVIAVDAPGHGESGDADADLPTGADLIAEAGGRGTYIGYSMGGRLVLHVAVRHPEVVTGLVLIGATPGISDDAERAARRRSDEALADRIDAIGVDEFLEEWLRLPLFAGLDDRSAGLDDRRRNDAGRLAASLRHAGTGTQEPLWDAVAHVDAPVLLIVGERDLKFRAIAERMAAVMPCATVQVVPGAGHTAHLEQPERTLTILDRWLADTRAARR